MYFKGKPLYAFGYGLSYTTFTYKAMETNAAKLSKNGSLTVTITLTNKGSRDGDEVVQLYVKHKNSKIARPEKELKAFKRIFIKAGRWRI